MLVCDRPVGARFVHCPRPPAVAPAAAEPHSYSEPADSVAIGTERPSFTSAARDLKRGAIALDVSFSSTGAPKSLSILYVCAVVGDKRQDLLSACRPSFLPPAGVRAYGSVSRSRQTQKSPPARQPVQQIPSTWGDFRLRNQAPEGCLGLCNSKSSGGSRRPAPANGLFQTLPHSRLMFLTVQAPLSQRLTPGGSGPRFARPHSRLTPGRLDGR
jgi:hypothetical protein